jgi:hypothetical protein
MVETLRAEFAEYNLTYSIGGQISFDVFPQVRARVPCGQLRCRQHGMAAPMTHTTGAASQHLADDLVIHSWATGLGHVLTACHGHQGDGRGCL